MLFKVLLSSILIYNKVYCKNICFGISKNVAWDASNVIEKYDCYTSDSYFQNNLPNNSCGQIDYESTNISCDVQYICSNYIYDSSINKYSTDYLKTQCEYYSGTWKKLIN